MTPADAPPGGGPHGGPRAWPDLAIVLLLVLAAIGLVHGPRMLRNLSQRNWEDPRFFRLVRAEIHSVADCFTKTSVWPGLYRPLTTNCYYYFGRKAFGNDVRAYHLVNAALLVLNALLLFVVSAWLLPRWWAMLPPVLFASRLAHYEVVLYTVEFQVLLATTFCLCAMAWYAESSALDRRSGTWVPLAFLTLVLLSKEASAVLVFLLTAQTLLFDRRIRRLQLLGLWILVGVWAVLLAVVVRHVGGAPSTGFAYDVSGRMLFRFASYMLAFSNVLVSPLGDAAMTPRVELLGHTPWAALAVSLLAVAALTVLVRSRFRAQHRSSRVVAFGFLWFLAAALPFATFADRLYLRYTYFSHAGLSLAVTAAALAARQTLRARRSPARRASPE